MFGTTQPFTVGIQLLDQIPDTEHYIRTLKACKMNEDDYFSRLIFEDITELARDIKESHHRDAETVMRIIRWRM